MRVLSIQSHVVHGYVGNRSAVPALQFLGVEVDYINSVQFTNHTGYSSVKGQVLNTHDLAELYAGLKENALNHYTHVITGYVSSVSFLETLADIISDMKSINPNLKYYCDPVMGDSGKLYVSQELIKIYKEKILPLADIIFPNEFEAELISGCKITDEVSALKCIDLLHSTYQLPKVIITSTELCLNTRSDVILGYASCSDSSRHSVLRLIIPRFDMHFTGTGDLFAAMTLARVEELVQDERGSFRPKHSFKEALQLVVSSMQAVLKRTVDMSSKNTINGNQTANLNSKVANIELKLVQSIDDVRFPTLTTNYVEEIL